MNRNIVCLKWGDKYSSHYVNVLYNMCKRHSKESFNFICLTDNPSNLSKEITIKPLPKTNLHGWWLKPYVFSKENNFVGDVLFLDLDLIVYKDIEKFWTFCPYEFIIIRDFTRHMAPSWQRFNSSVFRFPVKDYYWIWEDFHSKYNNLLFKYHGDQDYLYSILNSKIRFWPDSWVQSYKWEMRDKNDLINVNGKRNFIDPKQPKLNPECSIAVFHGEPNPHEVKDPWVIENWK